MASIRRVTSALSQFRWTRMCAVAQLSPRDSFGGVWTHFSNIWHRRHGHRRGLPLCVHFALHSIKTHAHRWPYWTRLLRPSLLKCEQRSSPSICVMRHYAPLSGPSTCMHCMHRCRLLLRCASVTASVRIVSRMVYRLHCVFRTPL